MLHIEKYSDITCLGLGAFSSIILGIHFLLYSLISLSLIAFILVAWKRIHSTGTYLYQFTIIARDTHPCMSSWNNF